MSPRSRSRAARPREVIAEIVPGDRPRLSLAEIDALGRGLGAAPTRCAGCARCARILCTLRRPARDARDRAVRRRRHRRGRRHLRPPLHGARRRSRSAASRTMSTRSPRPRSCSTPSGARRSFSPTPEPRLRPGARTRRGRGAARGGRRPRRMAGRADGRVRGGIPRNPARGHPRDDPRQPEVLRAARRRRQARQPLHPRRQSRSPATAARRSRRATGAWCARGLSDARHFWRTDLAPLPDYKDKAEKPLDQRLAKLQGARHRLPREARHAGRAGRAHRGARARACADGRRRCRRWRDARGAARQGRSRHRDGRRVPRAAGADGALLRGGAGRGAERRRRRSRSITSRRARTTASRRRRSRSRSRSPTSSTRWSASGRSTRSRRAARTPTRCGARRWASSASMLENGLRLPHAGRSFPRPRSLDSLAKRERLHARDQSPASMPSAALLVRRSCEQIRRPVSTRRHADLLAFFADRLKVYLRDKGARHDLIDAVFALPGQDDLLMIVRRVEALGRLLDTEDGKNLLAGYRRAANILRAEEKKDGAEAFLRAHDRALLALPAEKALADGARRGRRRGARERVAAEDFEGAMRALAPLRAPVDAFFLDVTVNADDPALRVNRPAAVERVARGGPHRRGFFEDRGVIPAGPLSRRRPSGGSARSRRRARSRCLPAQAATGRRRLRPRECRPGHWSPR